MSYFRMPRIQDELDRSIASTRESLSHLPPQPTSDPRSEILLLLHKFTQDLALQIEGVPDSVESVADLGLVQAIRPEQEKFKRAIRETAPNFWPFEKPMGGDKQLPAAEFLRSEEGGDVVGDVFRCLFAPQKIYINEVFEKAQWFVSLFNLASGFFSSSFYTVRVLVSYLGTTPS